MAAVPRENTPNLSFGVLSRLSGEWKVGDYQRRHRRGLSARRYACTRANGVYSPPSTLFTAHGVGPRDATKSYGFTRAGVMLDDLLPLEDRPITLFGAPQPKSAALMGALGAVNGRFGRKAMVLASEGMTRTWQLRSDHHSPRYATRLSDLPMVR